MKKNDLTLIWNQVPVDYYQMGVRKNFLQRFWHSQKINLAINLIKDFNFKNCLDVGCASGYMLSEISKKYPTCKYFGIDAYQKAIKYAKKRYKNIDFKVAAADHLPFADNSFDLILFYETIEHVENPHACLQEIKRVLRKNGKLILAMDSGSLLFRIVWFVWENTKGTVWRAAHLNPFKHEDLEDLILKSKFKINKKIFSHFGMEVIFILSK